MFYQSQYLPLNLEYEYTVVKKKDSYTFMDIKK